MSSGSCHTAREAVKPDSQFPFARQESPHSRFSQAGEAQAVLGGEGTTPATHGPRALYLGRRWSSGMESLWLH